jgi:hypothetical protein
MTELDDNVGVILKKIQDLIQRAHDFDVWQEPFVSLRVPMLVDLNADPFERAEEEAADY